MAQFVKAAYASMGTRVCLQSPELGKWVCWGVPAVLMLGRQGQADLWDLLASHSNLSDKSRPM